MNAFTLIVIMLVAGPVAWIYGRVRRNPVIAIAGEVVLALGIGGVLALLVLGYLIARGFNG